MPDFTSSLYLGLTHPAAGVPPWGALTAGRPAALVPPGATAPLEAELARLVGSSAAVLAPSTLHAMWDLGHLLGSPRAAIVLQDATYPLARGLTDRAAARGAVVRRAGHGDVDGAHAVLRELRDRGLDATLVVDGVCPACGGPAPLRALAGAVRGTRARLVVDDTQGLGLLGAGPDPRHPYGRGGGGSLRFAGVEPGDDVIVVASLAKALGAPLAAVACGDRTAARIRAGAPTRTHSSPPSAAALEAARAGLATNARCGDALRSRLAARVARLRTGARRAGLTLHGGMLPVQALPSLPPADAERLHDRLARRGVRTVLQGGAANRARVLLIVTAAHDAADVDAAVAALAAEAGAARRRRAAA